MMNKFLVIILFIGIQNLFAQGNATLVIKSDLDQKYIVTFNNVPQSDSAFQNVEITSIKPATYLLNVTSEDALFTYADSVQLKAGLTYTFTCVQKKNESVLKGPKKSKKSTSKFYSRVSFHENFHPVTNLRKNDITVEGQEMEEGNLYTDGDMTMTLVSGGCSISEEEYEALKEAIRIESNPAIKLEMALAAGQSKCMMVEQIRQIGVLLSSPEDRLEFVKKSRLNCLNQKDYQQLNTLFKTEEFQLKFQSFLDQFK